MSSSNWQNQEGHTILQNFSGGQYNSTPIWEQSLNGTNNEVAAYYKENVENDHPNIVVGIGTREPFSRLSLGSNVGDGDKNNISVHGKIASIAVHENSDGKNFHGLCYVKDISGLDISTDISTNALVLYANNSNTDLSLDNSGIYIGDNNVITLGIPRIPREVVGGGSISKSPALVMDIQGSMAVDGYISFIHNTGSGGYWNPANNPSNQVNIPLGSIWGGMDDTTPVLYIKGSLGPTIIGRADDGDNDHTHGIFWDGSANATSPFYGQFGGNITFSPYPYASAELSGNDFKNALSIQNGQLAVMSNDASNNKVGNCFWSDISGGIIWAEQQIGIGSNKYTSQSRQGILNIGCISQKSAIHITNDETQPQRASNSIIINSNSNDSGNTIIGNDFDCSNCIIFGNLTNDQKSPWSTEVGYNTNNSIIGGNDHYINCPSGTLFILGHGNVLNSVENSIIIGERNILDSSNNQVTIFNDVGDGGGPGNFILGVENYCFPHNGQTASSYNACNYIIGNKNDLANCEYSSIIGEANYIKGKYVNIMGKNNEVGNGPIRTNTIHVETSTTVNCVFVHGNTNKIKPSYDYPINNAYLFGYKNILDLSNNNITNNIYDLSNSYVLMGSYAHINALDLSNVRFAFGTSQKWLENGGGNASGNVFTIDYSGNTKTEALALATAGQAIPSIVTTNASAVEHELDNAYPSAGATSLWYDNAGYLKYLRRYDSGQGQTIMTVRADAPDISSNEATHILAYDVFGPSGNDLPAGPYYLPFSNFIDGAQGLNYRSLFFNQFFSLTNEDISNVTLNVPTVNSARISNTIQKHNILVDPSFVNGDFLDLSSSNIAQYDISGGPILGGTTSPWNLLCEYLPVKPRKTNSIIMCPSGAEIAQALREKRIDVSYNVEVGDSFELRIQNLQVGDCEYYLDISCNGTNVKNKYGGLKIPLKLLK